MKRATIVASTLASDKEFVEEQYSFSTADLMRIEFVGITKEFSEGLGEVTKPSKKTRFRLVDRELFVIDEERLPPNAQPLAEDAGIFRIVDLRRE